jgi:predicted small secreted protein
MRLPRMPVVIIALAALTLTACTNEVSDGGGEGATGGTSAPQAEGVTGRPVKVGFSAPRRRPRLAEGDHRQRPQGGR